ncbi:MAG: hypothetical protein ACE5Z5_05780 [Candidatus Bathyarchaeia archaeon]
MAEVLDEKGFVLEGEHILISIPAYDAVLPLRVKARVNKGAETLNYGPFPYTFPGYPEGVVRGGNVTEAVTFKDITGRYPPERAADMFLYKEPSILLHAYVDIKPYLFRIFQWIPTGTKQIRFLRLVPFEAGSDVIPSTDFGYWVGVKEQVFLPNFHINWQLANRTNMDLRTHVGIRYAEYEVEIPRDPPTIFNLIQRRVPAYWFTLAAITKFVEGDAMFREIYKVEPIPFYRSYEEERALREIPELIGEAVI